MPMESASPIFDIRREFIGEKVTLPHSYVKWLAKRGLTASSIDGESSNTNIVKINSQVSLNGAWSGELEMVAEGEANIVLTLRAGNNVQKTVFRFVVSDPLEV
jgi:hypothetical protein